MDSAWIPVAAAAIGAGGAVIAQVVTSGFTARRENRRLDWEKSRQEREWGLREAERFLETKREMYSRYIALTYKPMMDTVSLVRGEYADAPGWESRVPQYSGPVYDEVERLRFDIRLLGSPVVFERCRYLNATILVATRRALGPDLQPLERRRSPPTRLCEAWQEVSDIMRADLKGDEEFLAQRWQG
ncbi:MAG: hypothetical protein R3C29_00025 [Dehalococcoidia bacterium]